MSNIWIFLYTKVEFDDIIYSMRYVKIYGYIYTGGGIMINFAKTRGNIYEKYIKKYTFLNLTAFDKPRTQGGVGSLCAFGFLSIQNNNRGLLC
jgi:hypothetical protein